MNEHLSSYRLDEAGFSSYRAKNIISKFILIVTAAPLTCHATMPCEKVHTVWAVMKVSLVLLEHLHYIMEKGNAVVYLSGCNVAQGFDRGS